MIVGGVGVLVLLIAAGVLISNLGQPAYVDILVAPIDAKVMIGGVEYRNATYEMEPGEYVAEISREGYGTKEFEIKVERGKTVGLYAYLDPVNDDFSEYEKTSNSESLAALLRLNGYDVAGQAVTGFGTTTMDGDNTAEGFVQKVTIGVNMPIYTSVCGTPAKRMNCNAMSVDYDYDSRCGNKLCLIIMGREPTLSGEALGAVEAEIEATGRRFEDYEYVYSQNVRM